jgi:hypothetical protein
LWARLVGGDKRSVGQVRRTLVLGAGSVAGGDRAVLAPPYRAAAQHIRPLLETRTERPKLIDPVVEHSFFFRLPVC